MQKTKLISGILFFFVLLSFTSCFNFEDESIKTIKTTHNVTHQSRHFDESFNKIKVNSDIHVIIEQAKNTEITVITNEDFQKRITTKVENGTLYISNSNIKTSFSIFGNKSTKIHDAATKKVIIKIPYINELEANAASKIESKGILRGNTITLKSSGASEIKLKLEFEKINTETSSASKIELEGLALEFTAKASSASKIDADDLQANVVTAESSSASKISIYPIVYLKAEANSAGEIKYKKNPKQMDNNVNSGGIIKQD